MKYSPVISPRLNDSLKKGLGFTLIELMVAVTIFAVVAVGLSLTFFSGMKIWSRAKGVDFSENDFFLSLEKISSQLRQSFDLPLIGCQGTTQGFSFPYLAGNSIIKVSYQFNPQEKYLTRKNTPFKDIVSAQENEEPPREKIISLDDFTVTYLNVDPVLQKSSWVESWEKGKGVFRAVRIKAKLNGKEYLRTIFLPAA